MIPKVMSLTSVSSRAIKIQFADRTEICGVEKRLSWIT